MMRCLLLFLALLGTVAHAVTLTNGRDQPAEYTDQTVDRLIVMLNQPPKAGISPRQKKRITRMARRATGLRIHWVKRISTGAVVLQLPVSTDLEQAEIYASQIAALPRVAYAEPDRRIWPMLVDDSYALNEPHAADQWHLHAPPTNGDASAINLPGAWTRTTSSDDLVVAVLDTGALDHEDLAGRFVGGNVAASGRNFGNHRRPQNRGLDGNRRDRDPTDPGDWSNGTSCARSDSTWHGTHVAGTIGAIPNNGRYGGWH